MCDEVNEDQDFIDFETAMREYEKSIGEEE